MNKYEMEKIIIWENRMKIVSKGSHTDIYIYSISAEIITSTRITIS